MYDINSWHYRLILWTWGIHFFEDSEIDWKAVDNIKGDDLVNLGYDGLPQKYTARTVNFCPYCRALLGATLTAPFLYLFRLIPRKEKPPMTREQIRKSSARRSLIPLGIGAGINIVIGLKNLLFNDEIGSIAAGIIQISIGILMLVLWKYRERWGKSLINFIEWLASKRKPKVKVKKIKVDRPPSKIKKMLADKHDLYCPPVHFIDKSKPEEHV